MPIPLCTAYEDGHVWPAPAKVKTEGAIWGAFPSGGGVGEHGHLPSDSKGSRIWTLLLLNSLIR